MPKVLAYHFPRPGRTEYVAQVPGPSTGWVFTREREKALPLTPYWRQRFEAHCRRKRITALFLELNKKAQGNSA